MHLTKKDGSEKTEERRKEQKENERVK